MTSPFFGLQVGLSALRTQQALVDISNQNIANANTPGYSRQSASVQASAAWPVPVFNQSGVPGQLGTGVEISSITRARNTFTDTQIRGQYAEQGRWDARRDALAQVESVVNEPSTTGLSSQLTKYWQAWQEISNSPSDPSVRASLIEQGKGLAQTFNSTSNGLVQQQRDLDTQVGLAATNINDYARQIANINVQVSQVEASGMHANDLRDQRDTLVDKLSQLVKITSVESADGQVSVYAGGHQLVDRNQTHTLSVSATPGGVSQLKWSDDNSVLDTTKSGGSLQGLTESRDVLVQGQLNQLNQLAGRVITTVNALHSSGVGLDGKSGQAFFTGSNAADITLDPALTGTNGTDHIAAARMVPDSTAASGYSWASGDSSNAAAIAALQQGVGQLASTSGVTPGTTYAGPPTVTVTNASVGSAAVNSTINMSVSGSTVSFSSGGNTVTGTVAVGQDPSGNQVVTVDGGTLGVRLTLSAPAGSALATVLGNLNGQSVSTQASPTTINEQYAESVSTLGVASSTARSESTNQQVLVNHLDTQRQTTSGVSLDEEATNLVQFQRAYQAAARVITIQDTMLDTLINHTGVL